MATQVIKRKLYNGLLPIVHNPLAKGSQPRYVVTVDGKELKPKGVTTILGAVLAKDFVGWALNCMAEVLVLKLPNKVTKEDIEYAKGESARRRDTGGNTGTETHELVESYLKGKSAVKDTSTAEALLAYGAFVEWFEKTKVKVLGVEEVVYSKEHNYCGTYDCLLEIDGKVYLCDLKTTNASRTAPKGVYAEYFIQLGAYALAYEEQRLYEVAHGGTKLPEIDGLMVISAKKDGKLDIVTETDLGFINLNICKELFIKVKALYDYLNYATKLMGGK